MEKFNSQSVEALGLLKLTMVAAGNSRSSITAYLREIRYLCAYFPDLSPDQWSDRHIIQYMAYLQSSKRNLLVSPLDELYKPVNEITNIPKTQALL
jgi:hypothetical protein